MVNSMQDERDRIALEKFKEAVDFVIKVRRKCGTLPMPNSSDASSMEVLREKIKEEFNREVRLYHLTGMSALPRTPLMVLAEALNGIPFESLRDKEMLEAVDSAAIPKDESGKGLVSNQITKKIRSRFLHNARFKPKQPSEEEPEAEPLFEEKEFDLKGLLKVLGVKEIIIDSKADGSTKIRILSR
jgi:hypothetical protein